MTLKACFVFLIFMLYASVESSRQTCDDGKGVCVHYNLCKVDSSSEKDTNLETLDFEVESECKEFFEICCNPTEVMVSDMFY